MATAFDVARYILYKKGTMTSMKLQKLVYYSQAWSLVWDEEPLFNERIEAWANGPVIPELFFMHQGHYKVSESLIKGNRGRLKNHQKDTIDAVLKHYGNRTSQWLIDLCHHEEPWVNARNGLLSGQRGSKEIKIADMADYYSSLYDD